MAGSEGDSGWYETLAVSLWELRVVFTLGRSVIYSRERSESETEEEEKENRTLVSATFLTHFTQPDTSERSMPSVISREVTRRACFGAEATVASAGSRRRRVGTSSWKIVPTSGRRTEWSSGKAPESPPGGCERRRDSPGYLQLLGMERRTRAARRCAARRRGGARALPARRK